MNSSPQPFPANLRRRALSFAGACGAVVVLAACSTADRTPAVAATSAPASTAPSSNPSSNPPSSPTAPITASPPSSIPATSIPATSTPAAGGTAHPVPADCDTTSVPKAVPRTPSGAPLISVTAGANAWIAHRDTEPIRLALYADGTVITTKGYGSISEALPVASIGTVADCLRDWAVTEFGDLMDLNMGQSQVTDQGTTVVTLAPPGRTVRTLPIYAFGSGDDALPDPAQRANRQRLHTAIATVTAGVVNQTSWTPNRLRLIKTADGKNIPAHRWPGPTTLRTLLAGRTGQGCMEVTGETAARVIKEIGSEPMLARWDDPGRGTGSGGTFYLGILLPGQPACAI
ncbi:hypothetical protein [Nakamurella panacisegetis]|nr:hypothetical protein [Nakamurella panacisegetis]